MPDYHRERKGAYYSEKGNERAERTQQRERRRGDEGAQTAKVGDKVTRKHRIQIAEVGEEKITELTTSAGKT